MAAAAFAGLVLGVGALVVALALLSGFQHHIRGRLSEESPHLTVFPRGRASFVAAEGVGARLAALPGAVSVRPVVRGRAWVGVRGRSLPLEVVGREDVRGLRLDSVAARSLEAWAGDEVTVVSSRTRLSPLGPVPVVFATTIAGVEAPPAGRRVPEAVLPLDEARRLFGLGPGDASGWEIRLAEPSAAATAESWVKFALGEGARTVTWEQANRSLVLALRLERVVLFAAVFLIVVVAGLNLAATAAVLAATRSRDAAILAVMGASPGQVAAVFLAAGALVGATGTVAGVGLGWIASILLDRSGAIPLPARLYTMDHVPFRLETADLLVVAILSILWSVVASAGPARTAARADVAEALRGA